MCARSFIPDGRTDSIKTFQNIFHCFVYHCFQFADNYYISFLKSKAKNIQNIVIVVDK